MQGAELIQVARVIGQAEAGLLLECGVPYLGFPLRLPVHGEDLREEQAAGIIRGLPTGCYGVLITYLDRADELARLKVIDPGLFMIKSWRSACTRWRTCAASSPRASRT